MVLSVVGVTNAQTDQNSYSGTVLDESGQPMLAVSVQVEGELRGAVTDEKGEFTIRAAQGKNLIFSFLGYESQTVKLGTRLRFAVTMKSEALAIDDVVVTGYTTQRRSDISTAVSSLNMNEAVKSGQSNVLDAMQGQITGLNIMSNDGSPAGNVTIRLRGTSTITGGSQPLFVIDGVPQPIVEADEDEEGAGVNPLAGLNMDDIESLEVLKDAAAASIYGAEGSNGVIIITTKKGEAGKARVSIALRQGINFVPDVPYTLLTPQEYAERMLEKSPTNTNWQRINETQQWNDSSKWTDWVDEITQTSLKTDVSASVTGGSDRFTYLASIGYLYNEGIIVNNTYSRASMRLNMTQKVGKTGKIAGNFNYYNAVEKDPQQSGLYLKAVVTNPFLNYLDEDDEDVEDESGTLSYLDPTANILNSSVSKVTDQLSGSLRYDQPIIKGLNFTLMGSATRRHYEYDEVMGTLTSKGQNVGGQVMLKTENQINWQGLAQLSYNKTINRKHKINLFAAYEMKKTKKENFSITAQTFTDMSLDEYSISSALNVYTPTLTYDASQSLSMLGRFSYTYDNRYIVNATLRRDGSSKFGPSNKYATFPSVSLAWRVEQEDFMKEFKRLNSLKLRASYGVTGNSQIGSYVSQTLTDTGYVGVGSTSESYVIQSSLGNSDLKWETSKEFNYGADLAMFKNRLSITADYYNKTVSDMLLQTSVATTSGFSTSWQNAGEMKNTGFEFSVQGRILDKKNFSWSANFNISFNSNEVVSLSSGQYEQYYASAGSFGDNVLLRVGMPVGLYYGYIVDGVYNTQEEIDNSAYNENADVGRTKIVDANNDGVIDTDDRVVIGDVNPDFYGGFGNTFKYKNWELYVFFKYSYGNDQFNANLKTLGASGSTTTNMIASAWFDSWSEDEPWNNYKRGTETNDPYASYMLSTYIEDGSFLRLQTVRLTYSLPSKIVKKFGFTKVNASLTATNLALFTSYSGFDPEASISYGTAGKICPLIDNSATPRATTLLLSLDFGF